jgi:xanthine dehydrogenase YagR molybdenum-binding subunit
LHSSARRCSAPVGYRPSTVNRIKLSATSDGKLTAIQQDSILTASVMEDFVEPIVQPARMLYASDANATSTSMVDMNLGVATFMRAPGESCGTAVFEIAMDELAEKLSIDPVQLRLINHADQNPDEHKPWSSKHLRECYAEAAQRFSWEKLRNPKPGQVVEGNNLIGYGMATATYPANRSAAQAIVRLMPNGRVFVGSGTQDLGTGMYTIMAQIAAQELGLDPALFDVKLGDSTLPRPRSPAVHSPPPPSAPPFRMLVNRPSLRPVFSPSLTPNRRFTVLSLATSTSTLAASSSKKILQGRRHISPHRPQRQQAYRGPRLCEPGEDKTATTQQSFGAVFAEVAVDRDTHMVKVRRVVATYDIGTLMNKQTGVNQLQGGIVWGVGFALHEESHIDPIVGRTVNENLADYHLPVNADIGILDVTVLNIPNTKFNSLGARGIGEIDITGAAAAIANTIYNATGKRVRDYPITPDKIMLA